MKKKKYIINGKEVGSLENIPPELREYLEKHIVGQENAGITRTYNVNGVEYASLDQIPEEYRKMFADRDQAEEAGQEEVRINVDPRLFIAKALWGKAREHFQKQGAANPEGELRRKLINVGLIVVLAASLLYYFALK